MKTEREIARIFDEEEAKKDEEESEWNRERSRMLTALETAKQNTVDLEAELKANDGEIREKRGGVGANEKSDGTQRRQRGQR